MGNLKINACPVCGSAAIDKKLEAKDYTVSHQLFEIWECAGCSLRFTQNIPDPESVGAFYQSDAYISHTDTSEGFINKLYHVVRKNTLKENCGCWKLLPACKKEDCLISAQEPGLL